MAKLSGLTIASTSIQEDAIALPKGSSVQRGFPVFFKDVGTTTWVVPNGVTSLQVLCVAGGGGGGMQVGGGGGAGGVVYNGSYAVSPGQVLTVTVGNGGAGASSSSVSGGSGGNSVVSGGTGGTITAIGGGGGGSHQNNGVSTTGGSGGGGGGGVSNGVGGSAGTAGQGNAGGVGYASGWAGGGGGGAGSAGEAAGTYSGGIGGAGGQGKLYSISGTPTFYGGGGGGCSSSGSYNGGSPRRAPGGLGGGGFGADSTDVEGTAGEPNTGGGGGGNRDVGSTGYAGGSGIVIFNHVVAFESVGTTTWTAPAGVTSVEVLVVGGGGAGGYQMGGGGGGGGVIYNPSYPVTPGTSYTVTVGAGGTGRTSNGDNGGIGGNSVFANITALGGGAGGNNSVNYQGSATGGGPTAGASGGGSGEASPGGPGTTGQGYPGGIAYEGNRYPSGGGGGAGGPGGSPNSFGENGGFGGPGVPYAITGELKWYGGGGGGGHYMGGTPGKGAISAGDSGFVGAGLLTGYNAANNSGAGGGGGSYNGSSGNGGNGGSGAVYLRFNPDTGRSPAGSMRYNTDVGSLEVYEKGGWFVTERTNQSSPEYSPTPKDLSNLVLWLDPGEQVANDRTRLRDITGNNRLIYITGHATSVSNSSRHYRNTLGGLISSHQDAGGHLVVAPTTGFNNAQLNFPAGQNFSVVMWTYRTSARTCGSLMTVQSGVGGEGYRIWRENCGCGTDDWNIYYDSTSRCQAQNGTNNRYRTWQMQIFQRENDSSRIYTYYGSNDYAATDSWTHTGAFSLLNGGNSSTSDKAQWLHFGNSNWAPGSEAFDGYLGPIYIYRKALTARERLIAFNMYKTRFGLN